MSVENKAGSTIKDLRIRLGMSQADLAKAVGVSQKAISAYENGTRTPRDDVKMLISDTLNEGVENIFFTRHGYKK